MNRITMHVEVPEEMTEAQVSSLLSNIQAQCEAYDESPDPAQHYPSVQFWVEDGD